MEECFLSQSQNRFGVFYNCLARFDIFHQKIISDNISFKPGGLHKDEGTTGMQEIVRILFRSTIDPWTIFLSSM